MSKIQTLLMGGLLAVSCTATLSAQTAKTVPYSSPIAISSTEFDEGWTQIDANNDADGTRGIWGPYSRSGYSNPNSNGAAARYYSFSNQDPADDYLVSPAIHLEGGTEYKIMYGIATESTSYPKNVYLFASTVNTAAGFQATEPIQYLEEYKDNYFKIQTPNFTPTNTGDYYFAIYTNSPNKNYYLFASTFAVYKNEFTPATVTNLKAERNPDRTKVDCTLTWTLPTKSVFGDEFTDGQSVEKVYIYRDGSLIATLNEPATTFTDNATDYNLTAGIHTYGVAVEVAGKQSAQASATSKYVGPVTPATIPYTWAASDADAFEDWTVIKGEGSLNTGNWSLYNYGTPNCVRYTAQTGKTENDYLISPPFAIEKAGYYKVTYTGYPSNNNYTSKIALRYGQAPTIEGMQGLVTERVAFTSNNKDDYGYVVKIEDPGTYYFAAVATNPNPDYGIYIYAYSIGVEETEKTPTAVTGLKAVPGAEDALTVTLNWTCPTTSSNGETLGNEEYSIEVYKGSELLETLSGGVSTYTDNVEKAGVYTYSVKTVAAGGASVGAVSVTSPWVGPHLVDLPYSTEFKPNDTTVPIWDVIDANEDGKTWHYYSNSYRCTQSDENGEEEGTRKYNDYFLSPHFDMTPGYYMMTFKPVGGIATKPMTHVVGAVEAGTFVPNRSELMQQQEYISTTAAPYSAKVETYLFKVEKEGRYQFVFAAIKDQPVVTSTSDSYSFYGFTNVTVDEYPVLPGVATELNVTAADNEVLEATLTWTNPTETNVEGLALEAITKAVIIRDGEAVAEVTKGLVPGQSASFIDSNETGLTSGPHIYSVEIYNSNGKSKDAAQNVKLDWVGGALDITDEGVTHTYAEFEEYWDFVDADNNQVNSYDGWSISGTTAMKVDETNAKGSYDDWAVSPRFNVKKDGEYELTFETYIGASYKDYCPYTLEVYAGSGDIDNFVKFGEVTSVNKNSTASNSETTTIYIKGGDVEKALVRALAEEGDAIERAIVPAGSISFALRATKKGGVFVKTFTAKKTFEPAEAEPATEGQLIFEDIELPYVRGEETPVVPAPEISIDLELDGVLNYMGYQFDITMPQWLTLTDESALGAGLIGELQFNKTTSNDEAYTSTYRVVSVLEVNNGKGYNATEGIANLVLAVDRADENYQPGDYDVEISSVYFSTIDGQDIKFVDGYTGTVTVVDETIAATGIEIENVQFDEPSEGEFEGNVTLGESISFDVTVDPENSTDKPSVTASASIDGETKDLSSCIVDNEDGSYTFDSEALEEIFPDGVPEDLEVTITAKAGDVETTLDVTVRGIILGDSNDNGKVTVADVVTTANYIANEGMEEDGELLPIVRFDFPNANVILNEEDGQQVINVQDLTATVDIILEEFDGNQYPQAAPVRRRANVMTSTDALVAGNFKAGNNTISVDLVNSMAYAAIQAEIIVPEGMTVKDVTAGPRAAAHKMVYNITDNKVRVVIFSLNNQRISECEGSLFNLEVVASEDCGSIRIEGIRAADARSNGYILGFDGGQNETGTTGIDGIGADEEGVRYFTVDGVEVRNPEKGQILIRVKDEKATKVIF